ncbi:alpha/beta hydrolase [Aliiroseovarius marinus]|uniref:alpha/beta hydrolase n=1 Tax=Aliiroseovarius marinus TaxID=2500159 RepID=UPI003D7D560C
MDYKTLIDEEIWAFIRETERYYPPDAVNLSVPEQRKVYDRMCRAFFAGYPKGVNVRDDQAHTVPLRIYETGNSPGTIIYFHGGGYVVGGLDSHDDICAELCLRTGLRVVSVDYRLCPEHRHPAAFEDAIEAVRYVALTWQEPLVLAGDSAGGNLAASAAHALREELRFAGQVLIYPGLGGDMSKGSYLEHAQAPMLTRADLDFYSAMRYAADDHTRDATSMPLLDSSFANLPDTFVVTAACDPLADDGRDYRDAIQAAGGRAVWVNEPGLVHGYLRARQGSSRVRKSIERIAQACAQMAEGSWED